MSNRPQSDVDTALWNCRINTRRRSIFGVYVVFAFASVMVNVGNGIRKRTSQACCCLQRADPFNIVSFVMLWKVMVCKNIKVQFRNLCRIIGWRNPTRCNSMQISQMKHQLDATLCRFYFWWWALAPETCRVTLQK